MEERRQHGRRRPEYDKSSDFVRPNPRPAERRANERIREETQEKAPISSEISEFEEFKPRWWRAPERWK